MRFSPFHALPVFVSFGFAAPDANPEALPNPDANAIPDADPQTLTNNAPFSGAVYIVDSNGQQVTNANTNYCPNSASVSCGDDISQWGWCCPSGYTCATTSNSNGMIGCCPSGKNCGQTVNVAAASTVTVTVQAQQTQYVQPTTQPVYNGYCSTLTMEGPGLPTTTQGACGTILIVNEGSRDLKAIGYSIGGILMLGHLAIGRMFRWI
ncbi:hypothetical protein P280DRAFT_255407 [Massarina eburnea CBS 473.64]|uniref:Uncharacterized protein n=1 Tax=Massarina eburnea CBS 473.64 TaxID=1395130 RepID=A0A6A6S8I5_9PLEO|nr:hypothetical protein P280DRAFT_255407 [Massarina eburnea CBS 473.64]